MSDSVDDKEEAAKRQRIIEKYAVEETIRTENNFDPWIGPGQRPHGNISTPIDFPAVDGFISKSKFTFVSEELLALEAMQCHFKDFDPTYVPKRGHIEPFARFADVWVQSEYRDPGPPYVVGTCYINGELFDPDAPDPRLIIETVRPKRRHKAVQRAVDHNTVAPDVAEYHLSRAQLPTAPINQSPKKARKAAAVNNHYHSELGGVVAKYLDVAKGLIVPCCWESTRTVSKTYCMPEVELRETSMVLKIRSGGVHVSLHQKSFEEYDCAYVLVCDCEQMRPCSVRIVQDASSGMKFSEWYRNAYWYMDQSVDLLSNQARVYAQCIHIQALREHLRWSLPVLVVTEPLSWCDPIRLVTLFDEVPVISVVNASSKSLITDRVFIRRRGQRMLCDGSGCSSRKGLCDHILAYMGELPQDEQNEPDFPFLPPDERSRDDEEMRMRIESAEKLVNPDSTLMRCTQVTVPYIPQGPCLLKAVTAISDIPDDFYAEDVEELSHIGGDSLRKCNMCGSDWGTSFSEPVEKMLFTHMCSKRVKVYDRKCSNSSCLNLLPFQGLHRGFINFPTYVCELAWLYRMHQDECDQGTSIHAFQMQVERNYYKIYCPSVELQTQLKIDGTAPSWKILRDMLFTFKRLMRLNYVDGFCCKVCEGRTLVFDGVTFGPPKAFTAPDVNPSQSGHNASVVQVEKRERLYVIGSETRKLLKLFATSGVNNDQECVKLLNGLQNRPELKKFIELQLTRERYGISKDGCQYYHVAETQYRNFIKDLASLSPVAAIIHPTAFDLVDAMLAQGRWTEEQERLAGDTLPCLTKHLPRGASGWHEDICGVIAEMRKLAATAFTCGTDGNFVRARVQSEDDSCQNFATDGSWAPGKGILREVPFYNGADNESRATAAGGKDHCTKRGVAAQCYLVSGIFQCTCRHGVCHGFCILRKAESSVTLTKFLIRHWKEAPAWIFYDDACHAYSSALLREPEFFMTTRFCVDRFHWLDHKACSQAFNPEMYEHMKSVNTSAAEQFHAKLKKIREQAGYMRLETFMEYVRHFTYVINVETDNIAYTQAQLK